MLFFLGLEKFFIKSLTAFFLFAASQILYAHPNFLMYGGGVYVSDQDVDFELSNIPPEARLEIVSNVDDLRQFAENIFLRRFLSLQAGQNGALEEKRVQYLIGVVRDNILAEVQLERVENLSIPKEEIIQKMILTTYRAESGRFKNSPEIHVRHILIAGQDEAARSKAEKILADLHAGTDFEQLARQHSEDPGTAPKGGDLGFFPKGKMVPAFEQAAFGLKKTGELSPVVQTPFGFHIIRLEGHKPATVKPFDEVKDQLRAETIAKLKNDARKKEVERVRALAQGDAAALEAFIAQQKALLEQTPDKP